MLITGIYHHIGVCGTGRTMGFMLRKHGQGSHTSNSRPRILKQNKKGTKGIKLGNYHWTKQSRKSFSPIRTLRPLLCPIMIFLLIISSVFPFFLPPENPGGAWSFSLCESRPSCPCGKLVFGSLQRLCYLSLGKNKLANKRKWQAGENASKEDLPNVFVLLAQDD